MIYIGSRALARRAPLPSGPSQLVPLPPRCRRKPLLTRCGRSLYGLTMLRTTAPAATRMANMMILLSKTLEPRASWTPHRRRLVCWRNWTSAPVKMLLPTSLTPGLLLRLMLRLARLKRVLRSNGKSMLLVRRRGPRERSWTCCVNRTRSHRRHLYRDPQRMVKLCPHPSVNVQESPPARLPNQSLRKTRIYPLTILSSMPPPLTSLASQSWLSSFLRTPV